MKIAIPHWQGRVSPVFDESTALILIDIQAGREVGRERKKLMSRTPLERAREISSLGVDVLICGAISETLESATAAKGVKIKSFICGDVDVVADGYLNGMLSNAGFMMPGYRLREDQESLSE